MFLGFHCPGYNKEWLAAVTVLEILLGEGSGFSSGGPGKGMHSLLSRVINETGFISNVKARLLPFQNSGVFGIEASSLNNH